MPILTDIIELKEAIEDSKRKKLKFRIRNPFKKIKLDFDKFDNVLYAKDFEECDPRQCDGKWITGSEKNDLIFDSRNDDYIYTFPKDEELTSLDSFTGNDLVLAGKGNDQITGDKGADSLHGGDGDDGIIAWKGNDFLVGGKGHDNINGGAGDDTIEGGKGGDVLEGGFRQLAEPDENGDQSYLSDNDYVSGGKGDDILKALDGNDILIGGSGIDSFSIANETIEGSPGLHIIRDFERGENVSFISLDRQEQRELEIDSYGARSSQVINGNGDTLLILEKVDPNDIALNNAEISFI